MSQIKINLLFDANTTAAKNNIEKLSASLHQITTGTRISLDSGPLQTAVQSAQQLQTHLQNAMNVNTGKINLHQLNNSLKSANTSLSVLAKNLLATGQTGQQAFVQLANTIAMAQTPMLNFGTKLSGLFSTLTNTLKWTLASSAIQGVSSAIQGSIKHAQDLNKALNDIRIVTGYSNEYMANFADQARKAAKELKTTSTEYAKASLIFFQQGLSGDAVTERADTVVKMANTLGESMDTVSDWMTAIWNNFDNGSKSLEYYSDVLMELGATTASSADEITAGLSKFAAVADTVGLSYEYAASAVATVTAETRQSADVVGTAFKTIFARMEGLKLGKTLEDGTTLNQYSEALMKVGVNIKDSNKNLKDMDTILQEIGAKWELLNKDQQVALAQSVGGIRQYNQFIAMMDNWDTIELNVEVAENAEGTLQEQADIWGESWEAASKRVEESKNTLYENFLNDDTIVDLTNIFADLIDTIDGAIDAFGGLGPMVLMLMGVFSKTFFPMIMNGFNSVKSNISVLTGHAQREAMKTQEAMVQMSNELQKSSNVSFGMQRQLQLTNMLTKAKQDMSFSLQGLTKAQREAYEAQMKAYEADVQSLQIGYEKIDQLEREAKAKARLATETMSKDTKEQMSRTTKAKAYLQDPTLGMKEEDITKAQEGKLPIEANTKIASRVSSYTVAENMNKKKGAEMALEKANTEYDEYVAGREKEKALLKSRIDDPNKSNQNEANKGEDEDAIKAKIDAINEEMKEREEKQQRIKKALEEEVKIWEQIYRLSSQARADSKDPEKLYKMKTGTSSTKKGEIASEKHGRDLDESARESSENARAMQTSVSDRLNKAGVNSEVKTSQDDDYSNLNVATSQESLSMVSQMSGEYQATAQQLDTTLQSLSITEKDLEARWEALNKTADKGDKTNQKNSKSQNKMLKEYEKLADELGKLQTKFKMTSKQQDAFNKALDKIKKGGKNATSGLKDIKKVLGELKQGADMTEKELSELSQNLIKDLVAGGEMSEQELAELAAKMRQAGIDATNLDIKLQGLGNKTPKVPVSPFQSLGQSLASAAGSAAMAMSAFQMLGSAFDEGTSGAERWMSILMSLSMLLPIVTKATGLLNTTKLASAAASFLEALGNKAAAKSLRDKMNEEKKSWAVSMLTITWELAKGLAKTLASKSFPANLIAGAIFAAAATAMIAPLVGLAIRSSGEGGASAEETEERKEENNKTIEENTKIMDTAKAWQEQSKAVDQTYESYKKLKQAGKDTQEEQQKLLEQLPELIEKYKELDEVLKDEDYSKDIASIQGSINMGDVEGAMEKVEELDKKAAEDTAKASQEAWNTAYDNLAATMESEEFSGGTVTTAKEGFHEDVQTEENGMKVKRVWTVDDSGEDEAEDSLAAALKGSGISYGRDEQEGDGIDIRFGDLTTQEGQIDFVKKFEALQKWVEDNKNDEAIVEEDTYQEVKKGLAEMQGDYDKIKELQPDYENFTLLSELKNNKELDLDNVTSFSDYEEQMDKFAKIAKEKGIEASEAMEFFRENAGFDEMAKLETTLVAVEDNFDLDNEFSDQIKDLYDEIAKVDPDKAKFIASIDFNKYQTIDAVKNQVDIAQAEAEKQKIELKIKSINKAQDSLKASGMKAEDWTKVKDSGIKWGQDGIIEFSTFISGTYEQQMSYLEKIAEQEAKNAQEKAKIIRQENEASLTQLEIQYKKGEVELSNYIATKKALLENIENSKIQEAIAKNTLKEAEEARKQRELDRKQNIKELKDEIDRYHELNKLNDLLATKSERLAQVKERAHGKAKVKAIEDEVRLLNDEIATQDALIKRTKEFMEVDKKDAEKYGVKIDKNTGMVENYSEVQNNYLKRLAGMDEDSTEYKQLNQEYQNFKDAVSKYEETYGQYQDAVTEKTNKELAKIDKILEGVDYVVEIKIEADERQLAYLERIFDRLDDDLYDGANRMANMTKQVGENFEKISNYSKGLSDTLKTAGVSNADIQKIMKTGDTSVLSKYNLDENTIGQIDKYIDGMVEAQVANENLQKQIQDEVMVTYDSWNEKLAETQDLLGTHGEIIDNYKNIIDIVGSDYLGVSTEMLSNMNKASVDVAMSTFEAAQGQLDFQIKAKKKLEKDLADARRRGDEEEIQRLEDQIETVNNDIAEAQANVSATWGDTLTTIYESFGNNVENILNDFEKRMAGMKFDSFDQLTDSMEKQKELTDLYVDDYKKIYELSKMNRDLQNKMDTTESVKGKQILAEMEAEIAKYQQDGVKMSEYELEHLQKKYNLKLAEIALEEAQNAKSQVRMTRDSEGNVGYVFTADQNNVDQAQQKYEDAMFQTQEYNNEYIEQLQSSIVDISVRMKEEIAALDISQFASREAYDAEVARIVEHYTALGEEQSRQLNLALGNNKTLYEEDWMKYSESTDYKISSNQNWVDNFSETSLSISTGYGTLQEYTNQFTVSTETLLTELGSAYDTWETQVETCMEQAGVNIDNTGKHVSNFSTVTNTALYGQGGTAEKPTGGVIGAVNETMNNFTKLKSKASTEFNAAATAATTFANKFNPKIESSKKKVDNLESSIADLHEKWAETDININVKDSGASTVVNNVLKELERLPSVKDIQITYSTNGGGNNSDLLQDNNSEKNDGTFYYRGHKTENGKRYIKVSDTKNGKTVWKEATGDYNELWQQAVNKKLTKGSSTFNQSELEGMSWDQWAVKQANSKKYGYIKVGDSIKQFNGYGYINGFWNDYLRLYYGVSGKGAKSSFSSKDIEGPSAIKRTSHKGGMTTAWYMASKEDDAKKHFKIKQIRYINQNLPGKDFGSKIWVQVADLPDNGDTYGTAWFPIESIKQKFDTGGYTGEWGPDGRIAMLHQKEIVLNAHDTENFLTAIEIVRSIANQMNLNNQKLSEYATSSTRLPKTTTETLQQEVTIHAEFPNATNHNEIEEAFGNLVNLAAQYTNRK